MNKESHMSAKDEHAPSTASQVRGDIQRGLTGDKRPGFDPAAAPMETDAEAGGSSATQEEIDMARADQRSEMPSDDMQMKSRNFDTAMLQTEGTLETRPSLPAMVPVIVVGLVVAAIILGVLLR
jgi:hypothetical protein